MSQKSIGAQCLLRPNPIDLSREDSFLAIVTQKYKISKDFESLRSFLKNSYCADGHSSLGGEKSVKSYFILIELLTSSESEGILDIEKRIVKNNLITAKPDIWLVNGITKAIEIEPKVPQKHKVKHKVESLKLNGADKVLIAIAYNPENEERTIKQIKNKRLLEFCDGILLIDYTQFDSLINQEIDVSSLVRSYDKNMERNIFNINHKFSILLPKSRLSEEL